jgi:Predicted membrane protein (DUF2157)
VGDLVPCSSVPACLQGGKVREHLTEIPANVPALVDHWVAEGIITQEQAERIRSEQARISSLGNVPSAVPARRDRGPLVTEALGYLGGVLILVAAGLLTAQFWQDMPLGVRLAVVAGAAAALLAAGAAAVPERLGPAGHRLRSVLWLLCVGAVGAFLVLLTGDGLGWTDQDVALLAGGGAAVVAGALWWRHRSTLQQVGVFVALSVTVAAVAPRLPSGSEQLPGLSIWGISVIWILLGWGGLVTPRRAAYVIGGIGALFAASVTATQDWGLVLALATTAALVGVGVLFRDLLLLAVGAVGALLILPGAIDRWFPVRSPPRWPCSSQVGFWSAQRSTPRAAAPATSRGRSGRPARVHRVSHSPRRAGSRWPLLRSS